MSLVASPPGKRVSFNTPENQVLCESLFAQEDTHLRAIREAAAVHGLPQIAISPADGQMLRFLLSLVRVERAVEIGTLAGYSALWIARSMQSGGQLDCFEIDPAHAQIAQQQLDAAGVSVRVRVHVGPALQGLATLEEPVDFVFIDADKQGYPAYLEWAATHVRSGGLVALDNAFAWGALSQSDATGPRSDETRAVRSAVESLANDPRWRVKAMIPTNEGLAVGIRA